MKAIILIGLVLLVACTPGFSGSSRADAYEILCKERDMNYTGGITVPQCTYSCIDDNEEIYEYVRESCR